MKLRNILIIGLMLLSISVFAEDKPSGDIPIYPGGEASLEINLSQEDIIPTITAMLPMAAGKLGNIAQKIDINEIAAVLKDVKRIQVLQVDLNKSGITDTDIASYYTKNLPSGNWNKVFSQSDPKAGTLAVYVQNAGESLYGFRIQTVTVDGKPAKKIIVAKVQGKIDFAKLLSIAGASLYPLK